MFPGPCDCLPTFTNETGGIVIRQRLTKVLQAAATRADIDPTGIAPQAASDRFPALLAHPVALADPYV